VFGRVLSAWLTEASLTDESVFSGFASQFSRLGSIQLIGWCHQQVQYLIQHIDDRLELAVAFSYGSMQRPHSWLADLSPEDVIANHRNRALNSPK